jgi:hypothetical protein
MFWNRQFIGSSWHDQRASNLHLNYEEVVNAILIISSQCRATPDVVPLRQCLRLPNEETREALFCDWLRYVQGHLTMPMWPITVDSSAFPFYCWIVNHGD